MKRLLILILFIAYQQFLIAQTPVDDKSWEISFQDFFTNESTFDTYWNSGAYNNNTLFQSNAEGCICERQVYERSNVIYKTGGGLSLKSVKQTVERRADRWPPDDTIMCDGFKNLRGFDYTSGAISTIAQYKYGYFEIKCKIPKGCGYWPAFWMHMNGQEIDVVEPSGENSITCLSYTANVYQQDIESKGVVNSSVDLSLTPHVYAVEWTPGLVLFYLDDVLVRTVTGSIVPNIAMHVIANLAIDPWQVIPQPFSAKSLDVDYIKIYNLKRNCTQEIIASNFNFNTHNYSVKKLYRLSNSIVPVGISVTLRACNEIELKEGFEVPLGSEFNAMITACY